jgi:putative transposase
MSRPLRIGFAGALYHVTARGNERKAIVRGDFEKAAIP